MLSSCAQMRDYVYSDNGVVGVGISQQFGEGREMKDYCIIDEEGLSLILNDTKSEVFKKIGSPDKIERVIDGCECWIYKDKKLKLFFSGDYLKRFTTILTQ